MAGGARTNSPQQGADARRQLLRGEGFGQVVVGPGLEPGDHIVGVVAGGDHHDRHIARAAQRSAQLEPVDAREHDVDEHDVGRVAMELLDRLLATLGLVDDPSLVFEGELHRRTDALVVFDGQDACTHAPMMPDRPCD